MCSLDCVQWALLPRLTAAEAAELEALGFGIESRVPLFGRLEKKLPRKPAEPVEEAEEPEPEPEAQDEPAGEEGEEAEEREPKEPVEKLPPARPPVLREKHRLYNVVSHVHRLGQIVHLDVYIKENGARVFRTQFRGAPTPSLASLALAEDYEKYLRGDIPQEQITTLERLRTYKLSFDPLNNCAVVRHVQFVGLLWYIYQQTLIWGGFYDGDGLAV